MFSTASTATINRAAKPLIQRCARKAPPTNTLLVAAKQQKHSILAVCTAKGYDIKSLMEALPPMSSNLLGDNILHLALRQQHSQTAKEEDVFLFGNGGGFVLWSEDGSLASLRKKITTLVRPYEKNSLSRTEEESMPFQFDLSSPKNRIDDRGVVSLGNSSASVSAPSTTNSTNKPQIIQTKLAFSSALIQSVKLELMENGLEDYIKRIKEVPEMLASGRIKRISRHKVLRLLGEALSRRAELNLHSQLFDVPDLFWADQDLEQCYQKMIETMDVKRRGNIVNKKLDYANDIVSLLRNHLMEEHGLKLEWGIIILITCEVIFGAAHWIEKLMF